MDRTDAATPVLLSKPTDAFVERLYTAVEPLAIVNCRVEWQVLKHTEPCGSPGRALP